MNRIPEIQNSVSNLEKLAAQRQLYSKSKKIFIAYFIIAAPLAVLLGFIGLGFPPAKGLIAAWSWCVVLGDLLWLTPWQKRLREKAAKIQESFDCGVLDIDWPQLKAGDKPDPEVIKAQADLYQRVRAKMSPLENWYPVTVGSLPIYLARIICQRSNCWWDGSQRRHYAQIMLTVVLAIFVVFLMSALASGVTVSGFFVTVIGPMAPLIIFGIKQFQEQNEAANRLEKLKGHAEKTWKKALEKGEDSVLSDCRNLQDEIFENRKKSTSTLDLLFEKLRDEYEVQMNHSSQHFVEEAQRTLNSAA